MHSQVLLCLFTWYWKLDAEQQFHSGRKQNREPSLVYESQCSLTHSNASLSLVVFFNSGPGNAAHFVCRLNSYHGATTNRIICVGLLLLLLCYMHSYIEKIILFTSCQGFVSHDVMQNKKLLSSFTTRWHYGTS